MHRRQVAAIGVGGALGAAVRWATVQGLTVEGRMPWTVLAVNVVGSLLLGVVLAVESDRPRARLLLHDFGAIGFCGGLTTFSTFTVEVAQLGRDGHLGVAALYGLLSVTLSVAGVVSGAAALRRVGAASLALEEEP